MRIWDVAPHYLCRNHLLGEHRELHALYSILQHDKGGYRHHPETRRWVGKLPALKRRHEALVTEMARRGYAHHSPLDDVPGLAEQDTLLVSVEEQLALLRAKDCECPLMVAERGTGTGRRH